MSLILVLSHILIHYAFSRSSILTWLFRCKLSITVLVVRGHTGIGALKYIYACNIDYETLYKNLETIM